MLHTKAELKEDPAVGDTFRIGKKEYKVSAVGWEAPHTLSQLGHCTLDFKGGDEAERPGCISLEGEKLTPEDLEIGGLIEIYSVEIIIHRPLIILQVFYKRDKAVSLSVKNAVTR